MTPLIRIVTVLAIVVIALSATASAEPAFTPHSAEYSVKISVLRGRLSTRLEATDDGYTAHHVIKPTGLARLVARGTIDEYSEFAFNAGNVRPHVYRSHDEITKDKTRADLEFDWDRFEAIGTVNGEDFSFMMGELAHDRVSIQYQLMRDLTIDRTSESYRLFNIDEMKTLNVSRIGEKQVKVGAGEFTAVGIRHQAEGSSRATTLWCVQELGYLPVIIERHRKGKLQMRATLNEYTPLG